MKKRHEDDCYWWTVQVCTCGWFHELGLVDTGVICELGPDIATHRDVLDSLIHANRKRRVTWNALDVGPVCTDGTRPKWVEDR